MAQMQSPRPLGSGPANPDIGTFLLFVAVLVLLACTAYVIYLGCAHYGAGTFFRTIYAPRPMPPISAKLVDSVKPLLGGL